MSTHFTFNLIGLPGAIVITSTSARQPTMVPCLVDHLKISDDHDVASLDIY